MRSYRLAVFLGLVLTVSLVFTGFTALAATPSFTITATNVAVSSSSSSGVGSSTFTLTSVNGYAGSVRVTCALPTPPAGVKVPYCTGGFPAPGPAAVPAQPPIALTANEVVTGTVPFFNAATPVPFSMLRQPARRLAQGIALAGLLLFGFSFRRTASRRLTLMLLALGTLAGLAGISACGGNNSVVTPGTYAYTTTATDVNTAVAVNASVNVTVP
jgi:hypothetical protein